MTVTSGQARDRTLEGEATASLPSPPSSRAASAAFEPRWELGAFVGLLSVTAVLYLWGLGASGWANAFYSAAAQAGSQSWTALFFGSSDAAGSITVDKTPLAVWVMGLSVRIFGLSSWSLLVPQALIGVASVALLARIVRRWFTPAAGLIAGAALATTPVAALMFRFNNPDALLVLVLIASVGATVRALEAAAVRAGTRWLMLAGVLVGLGFMAKMLQALLVLPALVVVYLYAAPVPLRRRLFQLGAAFAAMMVSAGWWVVAVMLVPASQRPWIGGSQTNSVLELALGYNGLGRLTGNETGSVGGGNGWGATGLSRLFDAEIGGQISWLAPAALLFLVAGLWLTGRAPRTDRTRAAFAIWGLWLVVTGLTFSLMAGIFHAYYTVALAPAVAALVGMGVAVGWRLRHRVVGSALLAAAVTLTGVWSWQLLGRSADFAPALRWVVLAGSIVVAAGLLLVDRMTRRAALALGGAGVVLSLAGPTAYALQTASTPHTGSIPTAGPQVAGARGGPGGMRGAGGPGGPPPGTTPGGTTTPGGAGVTGAGGRGPAGAGGPGGILDAVTPSATFVAALQSDADSYTWVAAAIGSQQAAGYQLASGRSVMPIGGFNGSDPSPTLAQFQAAVAAGQIHYFVGGGGGMRADSGSSSSQEIAAWVQATFTATTVGGVTVYDLTTT